MEFGALPPEINSARMYSGPGSGPMLAAAVAWDSLVDKLYATASSFWSVMNGLSEDPWGNPAAMLMAHTATPYLTWLAATAECARQAALQARAAAAAYEAAHARTVPPAVVADNRSLLKSLAAMNQLSQNAPAMAVVEADYGEMWVQDVAAMYMYARQAGAACRVTPFTPPPHQLMALAAASTAHSASPLLAHQSLTPRPGLLHKGSSVGDNDFLRAGRVLEMRAWFAGKGGAWKTPPGGHANTASCDIGPAARIGELSVPQTWVTTTGQAVAALRNNDARDSLTSASRRGREL